MKRFYFIALSLLFALVGFAQSTIETALDLKVGENEHFDEQATSYTDAYWKYTASKDEVIVAEALYKCNVSCVEAVENDGKLTEKNMPSAMWGLKYVYPAPAGKTIYIHANGYQKMGVSVEITESKDLLKGTDASNVAEVVPGTLQFFGNSDNYGTSRPIYAKYTPEADGVLKLVAYGSAASVACNGATYDFNYNRTDGTNVASVVVKAGQENIMQIIGYGAVAFKAEMTHPQPGSLDMPFTLVDGANVVPAAAGEYWYLTTTDKRGALTISSDAALTDGQVSIFRNMNAINNGYTLAQSAVNSYSLKYDTEANQTYYIKVDKKVATEADEAFNYTIAEYKPGDRQDTPINITDLTKEYAAPSGQVTYFAVALAANEKKILNVEATSDVENASTQVAVYQYENNAVTGNKKVSTIVDGGYYGATYYIKWTSMESNDVTFKVGFEELQQGDDISNPLEAQLGENIIPSAGTKYYKFTPAKSMKLEVTVPEGVTVQFPKSTLLYQGYYETTVKGQTSFIEATEGNSYLMILSNVKADDKFTVAEGAWQVGEARSCPVVVEDGKYVLGDETASNLWLKYTVKKSGVLTVDADIEYSYKQSVGICKDDGISEPVSFYTSVKDENGNWSTIYRKNLTVQEGDSYLVQLKLSQPYSGKVVSFTEREAQVGETPLNPLVLKENTPLQIPTATSDMPVWVKMTLDVGDANFESDNMFTSFIYFGLENAKNEMYGNNFRMTYQSAGQGNPYGKYTGVMSLYNDDQAGDYYLQIVSCNGATLTATGDAVVTGIKDVTADQNNQIRLSGKSISVTADNARVEIYAINGAKVAEAQVAGTRNFDLPMGIYVVKVDGKTQKVALR